MNNIHEEADIVQFFHCKSCASSKPPEVSPAQWSRLEVGFTKEGIAVNCMRCKMKVLHLDFKGQKVDSL